MTNEISLDLDEKSVENFKKTINYDELEARHKRFINGNETIDDLINGYRHYKICDDKGLDLDVIELKHYKRLIDFYKQAKSDLYEANNRINDLLDIAKQKDKTIDEIILYIIRHNYFDTTEFDEKMIPTIENIKKYFEERCK